MSGLNSLYERRQDTEVPSYGLSGLYRSDTEVPSYGIWGAIVNGVSKGASAVANMGAKAVSSIGNLATSAGSAIANGASAVGNAVSKIPVVGNVIGGTVNSLGNGVGQLVSGNIGGGLSSLYTGADKLLGGFLPNIPGAAANSTIAGIAPAQGWMSSLYNAGDKALGGYLPNLGGGFGAASPAGGGLGSLFGGSEAAKAGGKMGVWDKLGVGANMLQAGAGIYSMLNPQGNAGAYQQAAGPQTQPVILGQQGGAGGLTMQNGIPSGGTAFADPTRPGVGGGGDVPTIAMSTGGKPISDIGVKKTNDSLAKELGNFNKNKTQQANEAGLSDPTAMILPT